FALCLTIGSAHAQDTTPGKPSDQIKIVATFSILADFVRNVGGDRVAVTSLVGANGNVHVFAPTPADAKAVADATLVVVNGLGLEGWIERLVRASGAQATVVVATAGITPRAGDVDHRGPEPDPHAWQSVADAGIYVANIRDALVHIDPGGKNT